MNTEQAEFPISQCNITIQSKEEKSRHLSTERCQCSTADTHFREAKFAENQTIIQYNIDDSHNHSGICDDLCAGKRWAVQAVGAF